MCELFHTGDVFFAEQLSRGEMGHRSVGTIDLYDSPAEGGGRGNFVHLLTAFELDHDFRHVVIPNLASRPRGRVRTEVTASAELEVRIHSPPAASLVRTCQARPDGVTSKPCTPAPSVG
jgi:hypothetical protein